MRLHHIVVPHNSKAQLLSTTMLLQFLLPLAPRFPHRQRVLSPRLCVNNRFCEQFDGGEGAGHGPEAGRDGFLAFLHIDNIAVWQPLVRRPESVEMAKSARNTHRPIKGRPAQRRETISSAMPQDTSGNTRKGTQGPSRSTRKGRKGNVKGGGNEASPSDICAYAQRASMHCDKSAFPARGASTCHIPIPRIGSTPEDVIMRFAPLI